MSQTTHIAVQSRDIRGLFRDWLDKSANRDAADAQMTASIEDLLGRFSLCTSSDVFVSSLLPTYAPELQDAIAGLLRILADKIQTATDASFDSYFSKAISRDISLLHKIISTAQIIIGARHVPKPTHEISRRSLSHVSLRFPAVSPVLCHRLAVSLALRLDRVRDHTLHRFVPCRLVGTASWPRLKLSPDDRVVPSRTISLDPFVCLFEDCNDPYELFSHSSHWLQHMGVHALRWRCNFKSHGLLLFNIKDGYMSHTAERANL
ncbi:Peptidase S8/S53, subtilisin/kexin/sedolisin [Ophiocordyceps camponoti-floridani]|uniref:Peptidase S8/S53, subtilisin/kexin/sedolisin n=1 Tax=Ophiocordyceps camponoti-floridani TaxID=2030778 RepID=A0A8H4Q5I8_9HYPO|nr:Peptidase S8/S53, subtilisin/kexin/sedolisin [Ophiocordyceps camponoti-floridani]